MRDIVALVLRGEPDEAWQARDARLCGGRGAHGAHGGHTRPGDWCQTQPGRDALAWLGAGHRARNRRREESRPGPFGIRIF